MRQSQTTPARSAEEAIKYNRRATPWHWSAEDKIRIALESLRTEDSILELCRRDLIAASQYYGWPKEFLALASGVLLVTLRGQRPPMRGMACAGRPRRSRRSSPISP